MKLALRNMNVLFYKRRRWHGEVGLRFCPSTGFYYRGWQCGAWGRLLPDEMFYEPQNAALNIGLPDEMWGTPLNLNFKESTNKFGTLG